MKMVCVCVRACVRVGRGMSHRAASSRSDRPQHPHHRSEQHASGGGGSRREAEEEAVHSDRHGSSSCRRDHDSAGASCAAERVSYSRAEDRYSSSSSRRDRNHNGAGASRSHGGSRKAEDRDEADGGSRRRSRLGGASRATIRNPYVHNPFKFDPIEEKEGYELWHWKRQWELFAKWIRSRDMGEGVVEEAEGAGVGKQTYAASQADVVTPTTFRRFASDWLPRGMRAEDVDRLARKLCRLFEARQACSPQAALKVEGGG